MLMIPVDSSNIHSIGFNHISNTLHIQFQNGRRYRYSDVSAYAFTLLLNANSIGSYFNSHIKGVYPCRQLKVIA